jgi:sugar lactone lactonase YvrE
MIRDLIRNTVAGLVGAAILLAPAAAHAAAVPVRTVVAFSADLGEFPEGITVDARGTVYLGMAAGGDVRQIRPDGSQRVVATLPVGTSGGFLLGLASPSPRVVYAANSSREAATHGVWQIIDGGFGPVAARRIAALPPQGQPNGLALDPRGNIYVGDSLLGVIWRITPNAPWLVERWSADPLLAPSAPGGIGANGVLVHRGALFVANTDAGTIVRIPILANGRPGPAAVYAADRLLVGADDLAFDARDNLYVTSFSANTLNRVTPARRVDVLAGAADGLDYPAGLEFGRTARDATTLYLVDVGGNFNQPKLQAALIGIPGPAI